MQYRTLDRVDTREDLTACLEQLSALGKISHGEACKWPCAVTRETVSRCFSELNRCDTCSLTNANSILVSSCTMKILTRPRIYGGSIVA